MKTPLLPALAKRCYIMSEPNLSGARVIIGFNSLQDAQQAHQEIAELGSVEKVTLDPAGDRIHEVLMRLAVKAAASAGMRVIYDDEAGAQMFNFFDRGEHYRAWNPLDDDGDNRRLQLALQISLQVGSDYVDAWKASDHGKIYRAVFTFDSLRTIEKAARMAVAYVAADIGKGMAFREAAEAIRERSTGDAV